ncbi:NAD(P)-dependent oxidoreductase [Chitinophaga nivalis]|uniref:NAD(P)-dependent oxidoreductase n=1 Tax=Chitinophaga nivalis TaxID=2991709 RepID=A0ABT3IH19_9BACT|nr:NAD(P)-dependent oxidoreductase [Chitinophaga nivalis]MCW3467093.1 NAD(P)-dependent oxidoreductase [Chitinophaga nivalis]MCW3483216.1 NAD(P)-dependent oxidoreductase [Chitinophaga nivalis]
MIAFLGMGLLGSNFVRALRQKDVPVQVWNRTASKATALETYGAKAFSEVAAAVAGAQRIHLTLKDDSTVDEVLDKAAPGLQAGAIIIDHTTTSVAGAIERTQKWQERGFTYLHAPVFMGPQNALESTGSILVSGDQQVISEYEPILATMTGKVLNFGESTGKATGMKLLGNLFLITFTAGLADTLSFAKGLDISLDEINALFGTWNPAAMLPARLKRMTSGHYSDPSWELNMARKDTGIFLEEARKTNTPLAVIPAIATEMDRWIAKGHGNDDWTVIAKDSI